MAFRVQDPVSGLYWKVDGTKIVLAEAGDDFTETEEGLVNVFLSGSYLYFMDRPISWKFTDEGFVQAGRFFVVPDVAHGCPVVSLSSAVWAKVATAPETAPVTEPVAEPEPEVVPVAEPEPEEPAAEPVAEPESEEDVPVDRASALIEEALNAQAAAATEDEDNE